MGNVVDMTNPKTITGVKKISQPVRVQNATFELFNGLPLNLSNILTISDDQKITGQYELDHLVSDNIELRAINGRNLSDYVKTVDTKEVQIISGDIDIEHMNVEGSLKIEDQVLNGCNLTDYMDVSKFTHFDSLSIQNGTLILEQPAHNNPDLATISLKYICPFGYSSTRLKTFRIISERCEKIDRKSFLGMLLFCRMCMLIT